MQVQQSKELIHFHFEGFARRRNHLDVGQLRPRSILKKLDYKLKRGRHIEIPIILTVLSVIERHEGGRTDTNPSLVSTTTQGQDAAAAARIGEAKVTIPFRGLLMESVGADGGP